ncbi:MAG: DUF3107 domain-containing protein [Actinomycetaceae bacterium]|nr:DUF3107 domain-containing protein [Actinomycetaceae bacterium]
MNVTIGISGVARELQLQVEMEQSQLHSAVERSCREQETLQLEDKKGRKVLIPASHLGYVIISEDKPRQVGFTVTN